MLPGLSGPIGGVGVTDTQTVLQMLTGAGLLTSLELCLDAGDINSYDGTSQTWADVSGNSHHFYRGTTSGAQASDPTFNGAAGGKSSAEYWSFDGADFFQETADHGFDTPWHKNNGGFTVIAAAYISDDADSAQMIVSNCNTIGDQGIQIAKGFTDAENKLKLSVRDNTGSPSNGLFQSSTVAIPNSAWSFVAVAIDEATGANGLTLQVNSTQELKTSTYVNPSASAPSAAIRIGANGGGSSPLNSGSRLGCLAAWSRRLSSAELTTAYAALQQRYPF